MNTNLLLLGPNIFCDARGKDSMDLFVTYIVSNDTASAEWLLGTSHLEPFYLRPQPNPDLIDTYKSTYTIHSRKIQNDLLCDGHTPA